MRSKGLSILLGVAAAVWALNPAAAQDAPPKKETAQATAAGLSTGPAPVAPHWSKNKYPDSIPEGAPYYIVVRGDTLWDLGRRFLGSPYLWPQIWDQNKYVADAHWIYPGDPIVFPKVALVTPTAGEPGGLGPEEQAAEERKLPPGVSAEEAAAPGSVLFPVTEEDTMRCAPYIVDNSEDESLQIVGSEQGAHQLSLATRDIVYLSKGANSGVKTGDVYSAHHAAYTVKHPETGKKVGRKIETTGTVRVILVQDNSSTAVIELACLDMHAGDYLKPIEGVNVPLLLRRPIADRLTAASGKAHGYVVDLAADTLMAGTGHIVNIDLGSQQGIAPGNVLVVYRIVYPSVPTSRNVIGEIAVVSVREKTATAKVTYSSDAIMPGDEVELR